MSGCWIPQKNFVPWSLLHFTSTEVQIYGIGYVYIARSFVNKFNFVELQLLSSRPAIFGRFMLSLELDSSAFCEVNLYGFWFVQHTRMQFLHRLVLTVKKLLRNCSKPVIYLLPFSLLQLGCGVRNIWAVQSQPFCHLPRSITVFSLTV